MGFETVASEGLSLGGDADLEDPHEEVVVRARGAYLESDEIRSHVESGKQVVRLPCHGGIKLISSLIWILAFVVFVSAMS